jgi:hypothetical protein
MPFLAPNAHFLGQPKCCIQFPVGQQPGIGGDLGTVKLQLQTTIEGHPVLPKNSAALEKLWFTRLPDCSSSAFRRVPFGIGCGPPQAGTSAARSVCRSLDDCAAVDNS